MPSPLEEAREANGLDPRAAADRLHIPLLRLARLEQATKRFTPAELSRLTAGLEGSSKFLQLSIFDLLTERELNGESGLTRERGGLTND